MAKLIIIGQDGKRSERELTGTVVIGRSADSDVPLTGDAKASRNHCKIEKRDKEFVLSDLGSANGTRLNGEKIGQQVLQLRSGDTIGVGSTRIEFQEAAGAAAEPAGGGGGPGGGGGLFGKVKQAIGKIFSKSKGDAAASGDKTITCSCGAVLSTASKAPGQKVGCPRCKKIYDTPGK
jgi:pSer/pThr/pTyr-binding forkhead associated (FHA) protein